MNFSSPTHRSKDLSKAKLRRMLTNLDKIKKTFPSQDSQIRQIEISMKALAKQQLDLINLPMLPQKKAKKRKRLSKHNIILRKSIEEAKKNFEDKKPSEKQFITAEIFSRKSFFDVLKLKKRKFGFSEDLMEMPEFSLKSCKKKFGSEAVTKRLNAILYNNTYWNSPRSQRAHLENVIERSADIRCTLSERGSPVSIYEEKLRKMHRDQKFISNAAKKPSLDIGVMRLKL